MLFAELLGAAELFARAGDAAATEALAQCAGRLEQAAGCDARVVKTLGSRLMLLAPNADSAARAAVAMHAAASEFADSLALGIGFHYGPVIEENDDVFGDTVNLAARLVEQAAKGQILLAAETAAALSSLYSRSMRRLYSMPLKGRSGEVALCELVWRNDQSATVLPHAAAAKPSRAKLTLKYRDTHLVLLNDADTFTIGREGDCGLVLADSTASRHHCTIHRRNDHFVLVDRSTNGTYVTVEGDGELLLQHDELMLRKKGWISFGIPKGAGSEAAEFFCD